MRGCSRVVQERQSRTFLCHRAKKDPMVALSPLEPALPIDAIMNWPGFSAATLRVQALGREPDSGVPRTLSG